MVGSGDFVGSGVESAVGSTVGAGVCSAVGSTYGLGVGSSVGSAAKAGVAVKCGVYVGAAEGCTVGVGVPGAAVSSGISIVSIICTSALKLPVCDTAMQPANASMATNINMPAACLIIE